MGQDSSEHPGIAAYAEVAALFATLSSPVRAAIVGTLADGSCTVSALVATLGLSQPLVSQHLRVLRGARLVRAEREGRTVRYVLTDDHVAHILTDALHHTQEP